MQKEIFVLKVSLQQKDLDIKNLNNLLEVKEETISENKSLIEEHGMEVHPLNEGNQTKNKNEIGVITEAEKEDSIATFMERINLKDENDKISEELRSFLKVKSKDDHVGMMKSKEEEIVMLKK